MPFYNLISLDFFLTEKIDVEITPGSLVWAKLSTYPYWPAIAYPHPTKHQVIFDQKVNVQFLEQHPSRAWIPRRNYKGTKIYREELVNTLLHELPQKSRSPGRGPGPEVLDLGPRFGPKNVKIFTSKDDSDKYGFNVPNDSDWRDACEEASKLITKSPEERLSLIVCTTGSDEEEESPNDSVDSGQPKNKRRRLVIESDEDLEGDDSEDEYKPPLDKDDVEPSEESEDGMDSDILETESPLKKPKISKVKNNATPVPKPQSKGTGLKTPTLNGSLTPKNGFSTPSSTIGTPTSTTGTPSVNATTLKRLSSFSKEDAQDVEERKFSHHNSDHDFIKPEKIKDANGRRPDHPDYDPRTLLIPDRFLEQQTPAMAQWWRLKAAHYDTILFFKMGKFYELFHMDAAIAVQELGIVYMKVFSVSQILFQKYWDTPFLTGL
ncbi:hypothetical protein QYM36_014152 [Artemia franciscana]|uniref:PWWP domain-containing protein n=1 Tax=Artemia franciscana TaxID=6661 RepID=A0AA88KXS9_ARTSF|nr:hypothetical protein QYM36_014152 [Artemia franciscana]